MVMVIFPKILNVKPIILFINVRQKDGGHRLCSLLNYLWVIRTQTC